MRVALVVPRLPEAAPRRAAGAARGFTAGGGLFGGDSVATRLHPPLPSLPVAMDEDHGPTSFSITRTRAPLFLPLDSSPRRRRPLPPLHAPLLFVAHGGRRRGSDGSKACDPSVTTAPEPGQSRGRLCELSSELTIALLHLRCKVAAATQVPWPLSHSCHPSRPQGTVVVGIMFDAGCIYSHDNGQQLGVHHRSSSVSPPLRHVCVVYSPMPSICLN
ncbi:uncharacterized protein [Triticum aestivum]|uniref:uncharacterized protein isoform X1 n=2 Tax=Triticum aestivum TaxID=4565 RepID=UPI001D032016|nr:uncharacterized protein LOC123166421 isoform X1 [Triticum aestivum]